MRAALLALTAALGLAMVAARCPRMSDVERYYIERGDLARYVLWKLALVVALAAVVMNMRAVLQRYVSSRVYYVLAMIVVALVLQRIMT